MPLLSMMRVKLEKRDVAGVDAALLDPTARWPNRLKNEERVEVWARESSCVTEDATYVLKRHILDLDRHHGG